MTKRIVLISLLILTVDLHYAYAGKVELTTYYPSPYGEYKKIITKTLGVGDTDGDGDIDGSDAPNPDSNAGDVWISGNVGIGTTTPAYTLDVNGDVNISSGHTYKINGIAPYLLNRRIIVTTDGTTYDPPTDARAIYVQCWGAGGGGGGARASGTYNCVAGGGGAGGYSDKWIDDLAYLKGPSLTAVCKIGAGGAGGAGRNHGSAGGATSVDYRISGQPNTDTPFVKANGGSGGNTGAVTGNWSIPPGGDGANTTGAVGDLVSGGGPGMTGIKMNNDTLRGGGGGSTVVGGGGQGGIDIGTGEDGGAGTGYGSGGGGAASTADNSAGKNNGGAGAKGLVIIWEYY